MRRRLAVLLAASAALALTPALRAQPAPNPYDVTTFPVVVTENGAADVAITRETWGDGLGLEVTRPAKAPANAKLPAVVFVNGVGGKLQEWEIYRSWARLVAARGLAGVTFEAKPRVTDGSTRIFVTVVEDLAHVLGKTEECPFDDPPAMPRVKHFSDTSSHGRKRE